MSSCKTKEVDKGVRRSKLKHKGELITSFANDDDEVGLGKVAATGIFNLSLLR